ncbi:VRR-NUC domain-containing protein, partial [Anaeromicropila populeti]
MLGYHLLGKWRGEVLVMIDSEKRIEQKMTQEVKKLGGRAVKFVSPGWDGVPDRIVFFPGGRVAFVEVKAPGKKLRPLQL